MNVKGNISPFAYKEVKRRSGNACERCGWKPGWFDRTGKAQYDWEPSRVATGVKNQVARLKALGNAVDPLQIFPIMYAIKLIDDWLREGRA